MEFFYFLSLVYTYQTKSRNEIDNELEEKIIPKRSTAFLAFCNHAYVSTCY